MPEYNPPIAHYCHVSVAHLKESEILKVIGKKGDFLKKLTADCKANYLWWNQENKVIEIWGKFDCMQRTRYNVDYHINHLNDSGYKYKHQKFT